ncbi:MAG: NUDIX hydrolase [Actinobacteria bacterium]|nr:NUDIX hydrolase [Actinomycetota bacterium]
MRDEAHEASVLARTEHFRGRVWAVASDEVRLPSGDVTVRDVVVHPGAVGVAAVDDAGRILLIRQFRHPVGGYLIELPAGLRDVPDEPPLQTARRELAEEAGITAGEWYVLVDFFNSPGGSTEAFRCYLARDLSPLPGGRPHTGEAEEADLPQVWVPIDEAVEAVLAGDLHNPTTVTGVLAVAAARDRNWRTLRPASEPMWSLPPGGPASAYGA